MNLFIATEDRNTHYKNKDAAMKRLAIALGLLLPVNVHATVIPHATHLVTYVFDYWSDNDGSANSSLAGEMRITFTFDSDAGALVDLAALITPHHDLHGPIAHTWNGKYVIDPGYWYTSANGRDEYVSDYFVATFENGDELSLNWEFHAPTGANPFEYLHQRSDNSLNWFYLADGSHYYFIPYQSRRITAIPAIVPEPTTIALLGLGLAGLTLRRRLS